MEEIMVRKIVAPKKCATAKLKSMVGLETDEAGEAGPPVAGPSKAKPRKGSMALLKVEIVERNMCGTTRLPSLGLTNGDLGREVNRRLDSNSNKLESIDRGLKLVLDMLSQNGLANAEGLVEQRSKPAYQAGGSAENRTLVGKWAQHHSITPITPIVTEPAEPAPAAPSSLPLLLPDMPPPPPAVSPPHTPPPAPHHALSPSQGPTSPSTLPPHSPSPTHSPSLTQDLPTAPSPPGPLQVRATSEDVNMDLALSAAAAALIITVQEPTPHSTAWITGPPAPGVPRAPRSLQRDLTYTDASQWWHLRGGPHAIFSLTKASGTFLIHGKSRRALSSRNYSDELTSLLSSQNDSDIYKPPHSRGKDKDSSELRSIQTNKATSSSKRRTHRQKNILDFPSLAPGSMPNEVSPSPAGSSPVNIPSSSRLPDIDLMHSPTTSKTPFNSFPLASPTPSISSLTCAHSETPDDLDDCLFTRSARTLDLFVEDLELSLKRYHSVNFDARLLLKDYGFQEGTLHQRSPDFQAGLLAILGQWETPHVEGFWLILNELAVLKEDPKGFVFDPNFKSLRSLEGIPDSYLLQATWGVLMFRAKRACERINNELRTLRVILGQHNERSIHSNDSTLSDVRREFLQNSPRTNVFQLLQRNDYRNGIPYSVQGPVKHWLQQLPAPRPYVPARSYRSETEKSMVAPSVLPSITTPHPVQVHFASTPSSSSVYVPGYGAIEDSHGVGLSSVRSRRAASNSSTTRRSDGGGPLKCPQDPIPSLPPTPRSDSPTGLQPLILPSRTHSMDCPLPSSSYLQGASWTAPVPSKETTQHGNYPSSSHSSNKCTDDDNQGQLPTRSQGRPSAPYRRDPNYPSNDNSGGRRGPEGGPGGNSGEPGGNGGGFGGFGGGPGNNRGPGGPPPPGGPFNSPVQGGRYDPPPPPGPNDPDGGGNPPDPPPPAGNIPAFFPRPPVKFRWQLSSKIPLSSLPEWNGNPTTVIQYVSELSYYQQLGDDVTNHLAQVAPFRFTRLAKTWFNGLSLTDRLACTANMPNFLIFIREQFMHDEWRYKRGLEFDRMYFRRGKEYRNELPIEWVLRRISYARLLYPEEAEVEPLVCSRVLARRPRSWGTYILSEHSQTIRELLERVNSEQPRLLYPWEHERKEAIENDKATHPANSCQQSAFLITTPLDNDIDSITPHLHEFLDSETEPAEALASRQTSGRVSTVHQSASLLPRMSSLPYMDLYHQAPSCARTA
ncbi:hypothetical protein BDN71DRAFT_1518973 [Pleurotus eryngii]|uniref:Uncharacterized protein n=1 Tax=Pleurotus eryngii TaxID=5323 RepID=A0A9P5ZPJ5_PLEER|nr:hypothetical protein BDN71DRAFT_1518973 [Pleurotus eryngii]